MQLTLDKPKLQNTKPQKGVSRLQVGLGSVWHLYNPEPFWGIEGIEGFEEEDSDRLGIGDVGSAWGNTQERQLLAALTTEKTEFAEDI